jgi:S-methylmethionine-dependent homocysteine/selenocysteine methylase
MAAAVETARRVRDAMHVKLDIGAYANAFPPQPPDADAAGGLDPIRADLTPERYTEFARSWQSQGATIIGGCCGIGPEHIACLRDANL